MKKLKVITGLLLAAVLMASVACGQSATSVGEVQDEGGVSAGNGGREPAPVLITQPGMPTMGPEITKATYGLDSSFTSQSGIDRMIIRTGDVSLVVNDVPAAVEYISGLAEGSGGYVVSSQVWKSGDRLIGNISFRVPADFFNTAIESLQDMAVEVTSESTYSTDVTEEYTDLTAKLQNLNATEAQLLTILEKAETVKDILEVQTELSRVRGEIEQTKGRMQYLEKTSAMSLINVNLEQSKLDIQFTADKRMGLKEGESVQFIISQIAGGFSPYSYQWEFGDGETSIEASPKHAYKADGIYTVSLTVTDDHGNADTATRDDYITVLPGWSAGNVAGSAWSGLAAFGRAMANIFIWIGVFFPIWIIIGGIVLLVLYLRRRRKTHGNTTTENRKQGSD